MSAVPKEDLPVEQPVKEPANDVNAPVPLDEDEPANLVEVPEELHADRERMDTILKRYETMFTLAPETMREIVAAFVKTLDKGLQEPGQVVVRHSLHRCSRRHAQYRSSQ